VKLSSLAKRIVVAIIGIPIALAIFYFKGYALLIAVLIIAWLAMNEYIGLSFKKNIKLSTSIVPFVNMLTIFLFYYLYSSLNFPALAFAIIFAMILLGGLLAQLTRLKAPVEGSISDISGNFSNSMYIALPFIALLAIADIQNFDKYYGVGSLTSEDGSFILFSLFAGVWTCDSAAFFVGKALGKRKLSPVISPNKSVEGAVAGFFGAIISTVAILHFWSGALPIFPSILIGAIIGTLGQAGDLAESLLKRDAGIKDSGNLLPGHGGALDRFDSILFAAPAVFIFLVFYIIS